MNDLSIGCEPQQLPGSRSDWRGYDRYEFAVDGSDVTVVVPKRIAEGRPWIWRARFFDHRPDVDLALLELGFHVVFLEDDQEMLGSPQILSRWNTLYHLLVETYGFARKVALEGLSRGGLYVYNWAAANPERVACIYADAPVCDPRSWPAGKGRCKGDPQSWQAMIRSYGFASEDEALNRMATPLKGLGSLAAAKVPLLHVCGDADDIVPLEENTQILQQQYQALGGQITLIVRKGSGHEHGLPDPTPIIAFIVKHTIGSEATTPPLKGIRRIVFLGDSITYDGRYIQYVEMILWARYPDRNFELINLGLPSETVCGLSEPGHANGAFPRPCLHERLTRALAKSRPDLVIACYGINDGLYMPFSEERWTRYQQGIQRLREQVQLAGADLLLLTPPVFDPVPLKETSEEGGIVAYRDYDRVLERYSTWLIARRQSGWRVANVHGAMAQYLAARRQDDPQFALAADGVHPGDLGHWLIARQVLDALGIPPEVDGGAVELGILRATRGHITNLVAKQDGVAFTWQTRVPVPVASTSDADVDGRMSQFGRLCLAVVGLPSERYHLFEDQALIQTLSRDELAAGVDVLRLAQLSVNRRAMVLLERIATRQQLLRDAWLADVGHTRPDMLSGRPLLQALNEAEQMIQSIREAARSVTLNMRLQPAGAASTP